MKGMIKIDEFVVEETGIRVVILGDKETRGATLAMAMMTPPAGFIMTSLFDCVPNPALSILDISKSEAINIL